MNQKPLISVIVPVYNVENVLSYCVDSLLAQTYENIEIILVDDGSTDRSNSICEAYAKNNGNVFSYHKENGGQGSARNVGLEKAKGEYIGFIDSDDFVHPEMYQYLYELLVVYSADVASARCKHVYSYDFVDVLKDEVINAYDGIDVLRFCGKRCAIDGDQSICTSLFKRELFTVERFRESRGYEDIDFKFRILSHAKRLVDSNSILYYYIQTNDSTSLAPFKKKDLGLIKACDVYYDLCTRTKDDEVVYYAELMKARASFSLLARIAYLGFGKDEYSRKQQCEIIHSLQRETRHNLPLLMWSKIRLSRKISIFIVCINFSLLAIPMRMYRIITSRKTIKKTN